MIHPTVLSVAMMDPSCLPRFSVKFKVSQTCRRCVGRDKYGQGNMSTLVRPAKSIGEEKRVTKKTEYLPSSSLQSRSLASVPPPSFNISHFLFSVSYLLDFPPFFCLLPPSNLTPFSHFLSLSPHKFDPF